MTGISMHPATMKPHKIQCRPIEEVNATLYHIAAFRGLNAGYVRATDTGGAKSNGTEPTGESEFFIIDNGDGTVSTEA